MSQTIASAVEKGLRSLSEYDSKKLLKAYGIPVVKEEIAEDWDGVRAAALTVGYPAVLKLCSPEITHKSERGLVETHLRDEADLQRAFHRLKGKAADVGDLFLVQEMIQGSRELVIGMIRDAQFGPCVMFGLGGIFTEILKDVSFRIAPIGMADALEMMQEIRARGILESVRGMEPVDREILGKSLVAIGKIGLENEAVKEIDVNPMIVQQDGRPIAVDALVALATEAAEADF